MGCSNLKGTRTPLPPPNRPKCKVCFHAIPGCQRKSPLTTLPVSERSGCRSGMWTGESQMFPGEKPLRHLRQWGIQQRNKTSTLAHSIVLCQARTSAVFQVRQAAKLYKVESRPPFQLKSGLSGGTCSFVMQRSMVSLKAADTKKNPWVWWSK